MSEARAELHNLIDALPEELVEQMIIEVRRLIGAKSTPGDKALAWVGSFSGPADLSTNLEHLEGFGRD